MVDGVVQRNTNPAKETDELMPGRRSNDGSPRVMSLGDLALEDRLGFIRKVYAILSC